MNHKTRRGTVGAAMVAFVLLVSGCGAGFGFSASPNTTVSASASASPSTTASPTGTPTPKVTLSEKEAVTAEAQEWVRQMVVNFKGVTTIPKECLNATFNVDLTTPEFYRTRGGKESAGAFGPSMGATPCEVSRNRVERYFRDSSLLVTKANETGVEKTKPADVAAKVTKLHNGPYQDRVKLANKVLGWYTDSNRELTLVKKDGVYTSNTMKGNGTTATSYGNKPSLVLETRDRRNGKVVKGDRMNCGDQSFKPGVPEGFKPPKPGEEVSSLEKKVTDHPVYHGNAPRDQWEPAPRINEEQEPATPPGGGDAPDTYTPAPKPTATPTPRPTPPPPPPPSPEPTETIAPPPPGCDPANPLCDNS